MRACTTRAETAWHLYSDPHSGAKLLVNQRSKQCLAIPGASPVSDVQPRLESCDGGVDQRFTVRELPGGALELVAASGLCVGTVDGAGREAHTVPQAPCVGAPGQRWHRG